MTDPDIIEAAKEIFSHQGRKPVVAPELPPEGGDKKTMKPTVASGFVLYDEGQYTVTILSVEEEANQWYKEGEPESKKKRWVWNLEMPDGVSVIKYHTGTEVGNKKANLTKLVAAILGKNIADLTDKDKNDFDTDQAIGVKVLIKVVHKDDDDGNTWHRIDSVKPEAKKKKGSRPF